MESCNKVVLVGLPGSGKTTLGRLLHEKGYSWVDLDKEIETKSNRSITEIIRVEGEQFFRDLESKELKEAFDTKKTVISVGGGCLEREDNLELIKNNSRMVYLSCSPEIIAKRVLEEEGGSETKRPVIFSEGKLSYEIVVEKIQQLLDKRVSSYLKADIELRTDFSSAEYLMEFLNSLLKLSSPVKLKSIPYKTKTSNISDSLELIGKSNNIISNIATLSCLLELEKTKKFYLIDENVYQHHKSLLDENFKISVDNSIFIPSGEQTKSANQLDKILNNLAEKKVSKKDFLIGIGGGVVGDLVGLVASTYMRGVNLVHIPTTLVAQVDSAIGGKTGINLQAAKNSVGTIYPAKYVLCDSDLLQSLPEREFTSGLAEVVKYAATYSEGFLEYLEKNVSSIRQRKTKVISEIIEFCVLQKTKIVTKDLCDVLGIRAVLNFGHTVGHGIEKLTSYKKFLHGEAVAIGMVEALFISSIVSGLKNAEIKRIVLLLKNLGLPTELPQELLKGGKDLVENLKFEELRNLSLDKIQAGVFKDSWAEVISADKKRESDKIKYITLKKIGQADVVELDVGLILGCIAWNKASLLM